MADVPSLKKVLLPDRIELVPSLLNVLFPDRMELVPSFQKVLLDRIPLSPLLQKIDELFVHDV